MTKVIYTDRSRTESHQRCARLRFLEYHQNGIGIQPMNKPLPLVVGGSVHVGLEHLLLGRTEDQAVAAALSDFSLHRSALALDTTETAAMAVTPIDGFDVQMAAQARELGMDPGDPQLTELFQRQRNAAAEFDGWLFNEQASLVEALVRAYSRRRLRPLLEEFEVLEVEREGDWSLASVALETPKWVCVDCGKYVDKGNEYGKSPCCIAELAEYESAEIRFMSRPDALLRSRADNSLYILSYKTAATWDIRKARDAEHDMQGLSEGVEVERRLGEWWQQIQAVKALGRDGDLAKTDDIPKATWAYLRDLSAPPRILGIRYEYLLKGYRSEDKDLSARFGIKVWAQKSHLIRKYVATSVPSRGASAYSVGDECWSYDWIKDDGSTSKLAWQNWKSRPVWEDGTVKAWIDALDDTQMAMSAYDSTTGAEPREMGYKGAAQALGYTATHPLDEVFPAPMIVYRSDDQLRDWIEQVEAQETRVVEAVARVEAATDEGEKRHLLNVLMPMSRRACSYPTECAFTKLCYGGDDVRRSPLESGLYRAREPHHTPERRSHSAKQKRTT